MKKIISICLTICMLAGMFSMTTLAASDTLIFIQPSNFSDHPGTWLLPGRDAGSFGDVLRSPGGGKPENCKSAEVNVEIEEAATYYVWARTRDYQAGTAADGTAIQSGVRTCKIAVNGTAMENTLGKHGFDGFAWELAGKIELSKGTAKVELIDSSANYARVEGIVLSTKEKPSLPSDSISFLEMMQKFPAKVVAGGAEQPGAEVADRPQGTTPAVVDSVFIAPTDFTDNMGTWLNPGRDSGSFGDVLRSPGGGHPDQMRNAITMVDVATDGTYYIWGRTRDYQAGVAANGTIINAGGRTCQVAVEGTLLDKKLGTHGADGFAWEYAGEVTLKKGTAQVEVVDSSANYARLEALVLTNDPNLSLPNDASSLAKALKDNAAKVTKGTLESKIQSGGQATPAPTASSTPKPAGPVTALTLKEGKNYIALSAESFQNHLGSWQLSDIPMGSFQEQILMSVSDRGDHSSDPAVAKVGIPKTGIYKIMIHDLDKAEGSGRLFKVQVGDADPVECGKHGQEWAWEEIVLPLCAGETEIKLLDHKGNYARLDLIVVTDDLELSISDSQENHKLLTEHLYDASKFQPDLSGDANRPADEIAVNLNGNYMTFDVPPVLLSDRTMVPFRAIFEALGCSVDWDDENQIASGVRNGKLVQLPIDSEWAKVDGENKKLDQPATLIDDRTMVPLRFVSEALGAKVMWDDPTQTVWIYAQVPPSIFMLTGASYYDVGTWSLEGVASGSFACGTLRGRTDAEFDEDISGVEFKPAVAQLNVARPGQYRVWVHNRDFATNQQGSRHFKAGVNGVQLEPTFGTHGQEGFRWTDGGIVELQEGMNTFALYDTSAFYARCDMVIITQDLDYVPSEKYEELIALASPVDTTGLSTPLFPKYAKEQAEPTERVEIENGQTKVVFYKVPTSQGQVVQHEIYSMDNGEWIRTNDREDELGYAVIRADQAKLGTLPQDMYVMDTKFQVEGRDAAYMGLELYKTGMTHWFIPVDYEQTAENKVALLFDNPLGTMQVEWELEEANKAPKVTVSASFNQDGAYTIGAWEGSEIEYDQFDFALAPYRVQGKRVHDEIGLLTEQFLFTPMGCYTLTDDNRYAPGKKITKGVVIEPSFTPIHWAYRDYGYFGIGMKGPDGHYRGSVFAPVMGTPESNMKAGTNYTYQYRVISSVADWFDNYKFVAQDLFGVTDYRENTYATLNDAIFNTRELMLSDASGWDPVDKGYWNMESQNTTSGGNSMEALQVYLLSEDQEYLEKRTIPTIANFLTRGRLHFNSRSVIKDNGYVKQADIPHPIGSFISGFNLNTIGGMYEMTRGNVPYLLDTGLAKAESGQVVNAYSSVTNFANDLYLYKYTGEEKYLTAAKEKADQYLAEVVYAPQEELISFNDFIYISYYPNLASLVDLYEITKEEKYLEAAKYTAQWLVTTLWVPGVDGDKKDQKLTVNEYGDDVYGGRYHNWKGEEQVFIGEENLGKDYTEQVDAWVASRTGLGLEQSMTFYGSGNIFMSMWAGDLLKLAKYTGEEYFADAARNAIVGRFANYPGYYYDKFGTLQMKEDYPYDGPDETAIYYHHIPPFLAMLEDFIINLASYWSDGQIDFPSVRQQGYAYFNSNQYGFAPGKFFDQTDMWLWLADDLLDTGNLQIDWLGARKDGVAGFALMNESEKEITTTVTLGEKVPGGSNYSGTASVFDKENNKTEVQVTNGKFEVTIPGKSLKAVVLNLPAVTKPAYAAEEYDYSRDLGKTVAEHKNGKGIVLQITPENYYAYVYITDKPDAVSKMTLKYKIGGGQEQTVETTTYPYEFIIPVTDSTKDFSYTITTEGKNTYSTSGTICPK